MDYGFTQGPDDDDEEYVNLLNQSSSSMQPQQPQPAMESEELLGLQCTQFEDPENEMEVENNGKGTPERQEVLNLINGLDHDFNDEEEEDDEPEMDLYISQTQFEFHADSIQVEHEKQLSQSLQSIDANANVLKEDSEQEESINLQISQTPYDEPLEPIMILEPVHFASESGLPNEQGLSSTPSAPAATLGIAILEPVHFQIEADQINPDSEAMEIEDENPEAAQEMNVNEEEQEEAEEREREEEEEEMNLRISQTPYDNLLEEVHALQTNNIEENNDQPSQSKSHQEDLEEDEEPEMDLHISQTPAAFPLHDTSLLKNQHLQAMNATYVSPARSTPLKSTEKRIITINQERLEPIQENSEREKITQEDPEEEEEEEINLCITPSQALSQELHINTTNNETNDKTNNENEKSQPGLTPVIAVSKQKQFERQSNNNHEDPVNNLDKYLVNPYNQDETNYSIYDIFQATPNQSGLSIIKNRGDLSSTLPAAGNDTTVMPNRSDVNDSDAAADTHRRGGDEPTQLDILASSQSIRNPSIINRSDTIISITSSTNEEDPFGDDADEKDKVLSKRNSSVSSIKGKNEESSGWIEAMKPTKTSSTKKPIVIPPSDSFKQSIQMPPASTTVAKEAEVDHLKEMYERKMRELEELRLAMERAAGRATPKNNTKNIPETPEEKSNMNVSFSQVQREEYAEILTSLSKSSPPVPPAAPGPTSVITGNTKGSISATKSAAKQPILTVNDDWGDDSGPLIGNPTPSKRKFNTFNKISSPAAVSMTNRNENLPSSSERSNQKMRRKFAGQLTPSSALVSPELVQKGNNFDFELDPIEPVDLEVAAPKSILKNVPVPVTSSSSKAEEQQPQSSSSKKKDDKLPQENSTKASKDENSKKLEKKDSNPKKSSEIGNKKTTNTKSTTETIIIQPLENNTHDKDTNRDSDHIPDSFKNGNIPKLWADVWARLESIGWYWTKGKDLVDFYYIRPDAKPKQPFKLNQDYFASADDVLDFIHVESVKYATSSSSSAKAQSTAAVPAAGKGRILRNNSRSVQDTQEEEFTAPDYHPPQRITRQAKQTKKLILTGTQEEDDDEGDNDGDDEENNGETGESQGFSIETDAQPKLNILEADWSKIWKILRSHGWVWNFGKQETTYYYRPPFNHKNDKDAVHGVHKFFNENEVVRFLRRELKQRMTTNKQQQAMPKTDIEKEHERTLAHFYLPAPPGGFSSSNEATQESQVDILEWNLASHRKKRHQDDPSPEMYQQANQNVSNSGNRKKNTATAPPPVVNRSQKSAGTTSTKPSQSGPQAQKKRKQTTTAAEENSDREDYGEEINTQIPTITPERFRTDQQKFKKMKVEVAQPQFHEEPAPVVKSSAKKQSPPPTKPTTTPPPQAPPTAKKAAETTKTTSSTSAAASSSTADSKKTKVPVIKQLFTNMKFAFSGISEKLREKLEILVRQYDGKVLNDLPKDGSINYYEFYRSYQQHKDYFIDDHEKDKDNHAIFDENGCFQEMIVLISQSKDFRKPKFITAVILGIPILHMNYLFDCIHAQELFDFSKYSLPINFSALHSYNLFSSIASPSSLSTQLFQLSKTTRVFPVITPVKNGGGNSKKQSNSTIFEKKETNFYSFRADFIPPVHPSTPFQSSPSSSSSPPASSMKNVLQNMRILNLTGMKIWDEILSLCQSNLSKRQDKFLYKQLLGLDAKTWKATTTASTRQQLPVDIIVFDPITYTKSFVHHNNNNNSSSSNNNMNRKTTTTSSTDHNHLTDLLKQNLLTEIELRLLHHCHEVQQDILYDHHFLAEDDDDDEEEEGYDGDYYERKMHEKRRAAFPLKIVSIDWITHCIAMNEMIPEDSLDLFQLPADPIHYPMAFKMEPSDSKDEKGSSNNGNKKTTPAPPTVSSGERYSKYDLVYFTSTNQSLLPSSQQSLPSSTLPGSSSSSSPPPPLLIGKILSFSRRNENSLPLVKVRMIDSSVKTIGPSSSSTSSSSDAKSSNPLKRKADNNLPSPNSKPQEIKSLIPKKFSSEMIISVYQLFGKVVVLHRKEYFKVNGFFSSLQRLDVLASTFETNNKSLLNEDREALLKEMEEEIFSTSIDYEKQFPVIPHRPRISSGQRDDSENDEDEEEDEEDDEDDGQPRRKKKRFMASQDI